MMRGIILAAGKGKRLRPLTNFVAKALLPIEGRPAIEQVLEHFKALGIGKVGIVIGHQGDQIRDHLGDGEKYDVRLTYLDQGEPSGTAKALLAASDFLQGDALVAATDCVLPLEHLRELCAYHREEKCDVTLSLKMLSDEEILSSATIRLEEDGSITRLVEKPSKGEIISNVAASPYYVLRESVKEYLPKVGLSTRGEYEIADAFQMMINNGLRVKGVVSDEWKHLSDLKDFLRLNSGYLEAE